VSSRPKKLVSILVFALSFRACTSQQNAAPAPDATALLLQAIPAADPGKYERVHDMKKWGNPYLIIRTDGVGLLDPADNAEILLKPDELLDRLARLPASAWPYGRVVAVAEIGVRESEQDSVAIRRNKGIVGGILERAHVAIQWVPSG
jgi:hypothetical protein